MKGTFLAMTIAEYFRSKGKNVLLMMDSIPMVVITGQVPTHLIGNDAFQECDTTGITRPCTKHNYLVKDVDDLSRTMHEAFYVAAAGRPGPVVIDLPKDVQFAEGEYLSPDNVTHRHYNPQREGADVAIEQAVESLKVGLLSNYQEIAHFYEYFTEIITFSCLRLFLSQATARVIYNL